MRTENDQVTDDEDIGCPAAIVGAIGLPLLILVISIICAIICKLFP